MPPRRRMASAARRSHRETGPRRSACRLGERLLPPCAGDITAATQWDSWGSPQRCRRIRPAPQPGPGRGPLGPRRRTANRGWTYEGDSPASSATPAAAAWPDLNRLLEQVDQAARLDTATQAQVEVPDRAGRLGDRRV